MSLDNTAKISDILSTLQGIEGINQKADLVTKLTGRGKAVNTSMDMATIVNNAGKDVNCIASNILSGKTIDGVAGNVIPNTLAIAGSTIVYTHSPTEIVNLKASVMTEVWSLKANFTGIVRVSFNIQSNNGTGSPVYGQIYKNGVAFGTLRSTESSTYVTFSEDLFFTQNDEIQVYYKTNGTYYCQIQNFTIGFANNICDKVL